MREADWTSGESVLLWNADPRRRFRTAASPAELGFAWECHAAAGVGDHALVGKPRRAFAGFGHEIDARYAAYHERAVLIA